MMRHLVLGLALVAGVVTLDTWSAPPSRAVASPPAHAARAEAPTSGRATDPSALFVCSTNASAITPCTGTTVAQTNRTKTFSFTVQNKNLFEPVSYLLSCARTGQVASCSTPGSVVVQPNSSKSVVVTYVTAATAGSGTLTVTADDGLAPVAGTVTVTVNAIAPTLLFIASVAPHLQLHEVDSGAVDTARFTLRNAGADTSTWSYSVACTGTAINAGTCVPASGTLSLAGGASTVVPVSFTVTGPANATGSVRLTLSRTADATIRDSGTVEVLTTRRDSLLQVSQQNPGATESPDLCVTQSLGRGVALQCGDLRVVHALPPVWTRTATRAPVLLYGSRFAHPRPLVRGDVTLPDARIPDSVVAQLLDSTGVAIPTARGAWAGSQWRARSSRRIAVHFDGAAWPQGRHRYTLRTQRYYGVTPETNTVTGEFWLVNRTASPYGAGWWIAGLETLTKAGNDLLWIGGDGRARRYANVAANTWVAPSVTRLDTIVKNGAWYERHLAGGNRVLFDTAALRHTWTLTPRFDSTRFAYKSSPTRLDSIIVPSGSTARAYTFTYDASLHLRAVVAPALGVTRRADSLVTTANGDVTQLRQRDGTNVFFLYDAGESHRINARIDERSDTTRFAFEAGSTVSTVSLPRAAGVRDTLRLVAGEIQGLAGTAARPLELAVTLVDGLRTDLGDTTRFWLDRFGAPRRIRNALGDETQLTRGNATFPAVVTRLRQANGQVLGASYDARGNVATLTDSSSFDGVRYQTTTTLWHGTWDRDTLTYTALGDSIWSRYDANGNLLWRQIGKDSTTRTVFTYETLAPRRGLLLTSVTAQGVKDSVVYDAALLNVQRVNSAHGVYVAYARDAIGRVVKASRPYDASANERQDSTGFDAMDRDTLTRTWAPAETLVVRSSYDPSGNRLTLAKRSIPDSAGTATISQSFAYDFMHRLTSETLVGFNTIAYTYDAAGNLLSGGRVPTTNSYDALNRRWRAIGSDTAQFVFDEVGNLRAAFNPVARIRRDYAVNGTLLRDSLRVVNRRISERVFTANVYGIQYGYDVNERLTTLTHPANLAPAGAAAQRYVYAPRTGLLDSVVDVLGNRFAWRYDKDQRVVGVIRRAGLADSIVETLAYDSLARLVKRRQEVFPGNVVLHNDSLRYDRAGRILYNGADSAAYSPLGNLTRATNATAGSFEDYRSDALGLRRYGRNTASLQGPTTYTYVPNSERLQVQVVGSLQPANVSAESTFFGYTTYGAIGDQTRRTWYAPSLGVFTAREVRQTVNTYDLARRLTKARYQLDTIPSPGLQYQQYTRSETYRYDPLGRRVWREMIRDTANNVCQTHDQSSGCRNEVTRTVWDGAQILYDIRALADTIGDGSEGVPSNATFTGRVGYTHATGIDTPLDLFKGTDLVLPYTDWRGAYDKGTCPSTPCGNSYYFPGASETAYGDGPKLLNGPPSWYGELITGQADGSGYRYRRNRYLDPVTGKFTQEDPIGLAGGLNTYGFADGDPVQFSDPFGLLACPPYCDVFQQLAAWAPAMKGALTATAAITVAPAAAAIGVDAMAAGAGISALNIASAGFGTAIPTAANPRLQNTISALFRATDKLPGGTAAAIRYEAITGELVGGRPHLLKGIERIANLERILRGQNLDPKDLRTAQKLLSDLRSAVRFAESLRKQ